jgi:hypothetical protein
MRSNIYPRWRTSYYRPTSSENISRTKQNMKIGKRSKHKHIVSKVLSNEKIKIYIAISLSEIHF